MTRILGTLSAMEKSRFEAYTKSTLPAANAIRTYVAHLLLLHQHNQLAASCRSTTGLLGTNGRSRGSSSTATTTTNAHANAHANTTNADGAHGTTTTTTTTAGNAVQQQQYHHQRLGTGVPHLEHAMMKSMQLQQQQQQKSQRPLHDLVQPGEADSIVIIVSALAKAYAQRLVAAARRVANVMTTTTTLSTLYSNGVSQQQQQQQQPLQVHHIQLAHDARVKAGIDPGFFMQRSGSHSFHNTHNRGMQAPWALGSSSSSSSSCVGTIAAAALGQEYGGTLVLDRHELLRHAALQAQEEYDDQHHANGELSRSDTYHDDYHVVHVDDNDDDIVVDDDTVTATNVISVENVVKEDASQVVVVAPVAASTNYPTIVEEMPFERPETSTPSMDLEPLEDLPSVLPINKKLPSPPPQLPPPPLDEVETTIQMDVASPPVVSTDTSTATMMTTTTMTTMAPTTPSMNATIVPVIPASTTAVPPSAPPAPSKSQPMSMEDALLMNLDDDDSDDDSDEDLTL